MKEEIQEHVRNLFAQGKIKGFLALKQEGTDVGPHLFTEAEELGELSLGDRENPAEARYPLDKILTRLASQYPNETFAVLVRGCDERALRLLFSVSMLDADHVIPVGFACPAELAEKHQCWKPFPDALVAGEPAQGAAGGEDPVGSQMDLLGKLQEWFDTFDRCIKCFGCRNICPVCYCHECSLEEAALISRGELPPANPNFLMTRAMHMVGRSLCVYCGLCEEVCPADIPLKSLYKLVAKVVGQEGTTPEGLAAKAAHSWQSEVTLGTKH
jgi:formate dehydrogenase subunit beta